MSGGARQPGGITQEESNRECANYIAGMCDELAKLAQKSGFDLGAYLLAMAAVEFAIQKARPKRSARVESSTT